MTQEKSISFINNRTDVRGGRNGDMLLYFKNWYPYFTGKQNQVFRILDDKTVINGQPVLIKIGHWDKMLIQNANVLKQTNMSAIKAYIEANIEAEPNVKSDWDEADSSSDAFIENKNRIQTFTGSDLTNRQITLTNYPKSECPITALFMNGKRITKTNYEEQATTSDILLTINFLPQPTDIFKLRIL